MDAAKMSRGHGRGQGQRWGCCQKHLLVLGRTRDCRYQWEGRLQGLSRSPNLVHHLQGPQECRLVHCCNLMLVAPMQGNKEYLHTGGPSSTFDLFVEGAGTYVVAISGEGSSSLKG